SWFQSQQRCQAPGDTPAAYRAIRKRHVSISTEMPGPWRLGRILPLYRWWIGFNLNRDARPLATLFLLIVSIGLGGFNLNRDARPLATTRSSGMGWLKRSF